ncbi:MAG: CDP-glucose 4,6-dehydratase [Lachnospiraceae bacterium]|nr:CDP-glucose 4,6-dehydratase [Lachnospiraceae bacterium]
MLDFYRGKKVLITGHTGFKGSWMCRMLLEAGAEVYGYALPPAEEGSLFALAGLQEKMDSTLADIRDLNRLAETFERVKPEIVIHMAAQPLVRTSYENPVYTYDVNVMGTVHVLECIRKTESVRSFVNVTTDKVYLNREWDWGYRENEELNGFDPYSNSKSCSELVTACYRNSFFTGKKTAITTARAGNVIGGGDFAKDRIVPDCIRAAMNKQEIIVRNPYSIRPYQHVLEPVSTYLLIAAKQYEDAAYAGSYNIGPEEADCLKTGRLVDIFCETWQELLGEKVSWVNKYDGGPHEAGILKLDCAKLKRVFGWSPVWNADTAIRKVIEWQRDYVNGISADECMSRQIKEYLAQTAKWKEA